jgi:phage portal protein BeeE
MSLFHGLFHSRDKPRNALNGSAFSFLFGGTTSGKAVNERSAMQMTAVYSCVRILSEAVASLPLHLYRYRRLDRRRGRVSRERRHLRPGLHWRVQAGHHHQRQ